MPRAAAGQDFLASLGRLFQEVHARDAAGTNGFPLVAKQLVDLLTAPRAGFNPVTLPDGSAPETVIQLPSAAFKPDARLALRLQGATDPAGFLAVLGQAFEEHMEEQHGRRSRKRGSDSAAGATPRKRIIRGTAGAGPTPGYADKPATPVSQTSAPVDLEQDAAGRLPSPPATSNNAVVRMDIRRDESAVMSPSAFIRRATRGGVPRTERDIVGPEDDECEIVAAGPSPAAVIEVPSDESDDDDNDNDVVDLDSDLEMQDATVTGDCVHADLSIRALQGTFTPPRHGMGSKPEARPTETLKHIIDDVSNTTPEQWAAYRPKLIESLLPYAEMEHARLSDAGPAAARDAVARLDAAVARLGTDMAAIRPGDWKRYGAKLRRLCGSPSFLACGFQQRLWRVMDVMYVEEETGAMESGDWDRLETVAKIVATVCEAMGPVGEGAGEVSQRWFCSKVQDIRFLKRIMTSINRKTRVLRVREEEEGGEEEGEE